MHCSHNGEIVTKRPGCKVLNFWGKEEGGEKKKE